MTEQKTIQELMTEHRINQASAIRLYNDLQAIEEPLDLASENPSPSYDFQIDISLNYSTYLGQEIAHQEFSLAGEYNNLPLFSYKRTSSDYNLLYVSEIGKSISRNYFLAFSSDIPLYRQFALARRFYRNPISFEVVLKGTHPLTKEPFKVVFDELAYDEEDAYHQFSFYYAFNPTEDSFAELIDLFMLSESYLKLNIPKANTYVRQLLKRTLEEKSKDNLSMFMFRDCTVEQVSLRHNQIRVLDSL